MTTSSNGRRARANLALLSLALPAASAFAQSPVARQAFGEPDTRVEFSAGAYQSDNIRRVDTGEEDETLASVGLSLDYVRDGSRLDVNAIGDLDYVEYLEDTFDNELLGYFDGQAAFEAVPGRFFWDAQATHGQLLRNPLAAETPDNLDTINYFSTGPRLNLRVADSTELRLNGIYATTKYDGELLDSDRYGGGAALARILSAASSVSLNVSTQRVEFQDQDVLQRDYDRQEAFVRYDTTGGRTVIAVEAGYTQVDDDVRDSSGTLLRLDASRRVSPSSVLSVRLSQQFSDAADIARTRLDQQSPVGGSLALATRGAFEEKTAEVAWRYDRSRTRAQLSFLRTDEDYERDVLFNRTLSVSSAQYSRRLTPVISVRVMAAYRQQDFDNTDFESDELDLGVALDWDFGRKAGLTLRYDHNDRDASIAAAEYTESRIGLVLTYRVAGAP